MAHGRHRHLVLQGAAHRGGGLQARSRCEGVDPSGPGKALPLALGPLAGPGTASNTSGGDEKPHEGDRAVRGEDAVH